MAELGEANIGGRMVPAWILNGNANGLDISESSEYPGCFYRKLADGTIEWFNPPMLLGVEYRTTERYQGKPVYVKLVDCGNVASGAKTINFGYSDSQAFIISVHGVMKSSSGKSFAAPRNNGTDVVSCHSDGSGIVVWSKTSAYESYTINCLVKYTKTTD